MIDFVLLNLEALLTLGLGVGALAGAVVMILQPSPMRVAMALIWTMVCLGGIYGLLGVHFIAAFQVLIYVGAVMVFMVYAIMLFEARAAGSRLFSLTLWPGLIAGALLLVAVVAGVWSQLPATRGDAGITSYGMARFAKAFLGEYWLHFELTSVLLVVAVVAALAVIRVNRKAEAKARRG